MILRQVALRIVILFLTLSGLLSLTLKFTKKREKHSSPKLCIQQELTSISKIEDVAWINTKRQNWTNEEFNYAAQKRHTISFKKARSKQKKRSLSIIACPFYPYARGGRIAKWDCGYEKAQQILQVVPVVNGCRADLNSKEQESQFIRALHNKTLWIMGESLSVEMFIALACRLYKRSDSSFYTVGDESLDNVRNEKLKLHWKTLHTSDDMRGIHCVRVNEGISQARICLIRIHKYPFEFGHFETKYQYYRSLQHFKEFSLLTSPHDILLLGFGIGINSHFVESGKWTYEKQVSTFLKWYHLNKALLPRLIWREIPAQHFPTDTGMYDKFSTGIACKSLPLQNDTSLRESNWRNTIADSIAGTYDIPVLKLWLLSAERVDGHIGTDCTHYCLPGIPDIWVAMLMQMVQSL